MGAFDFLNNIVGGLGNLLGDHKNTTTNTNAASSGTQAATGFSQSNLWPQLSGLFGNFSSAFTPQGPNGYQTGAANTQFGLATSALNPAFNAANTAAGGGLYNAGSYLPYMSQYIPQVVGSTIDAQTLQKKADLGLLRGNEAVRGALGNNTGAEGAYLAGRAPLDTQAINQILQQGFGQANTNAQAAAGIGLQGAQTAAGLTNAGTGATNALFNQGQQLWQNPFLQFGQVSSAISPWAAASGQNTSNQGTYSGNQNTVGNTNTTGFNGGNILGGLGTLAGNIWKAWPFADGGAVKGYALGGGVGHGSFADKVEHAFHSFHRMRKHAQDGGKVRHFDIGGWVPTISGSLGDTSNDYWDTIQNQALGNDPRLNGETGFGSFAQGLGKTFKDMGATGSKNDSSVGAEPQMKTPDLIGQGFQRLSTLMRPPVLGAGYAVGGDVERRGFADGDAVLPEGYDPSGMDVAPLGEPAAPAVPSYLGARERAVPAVPYSGYHRDVPQSAIAPISKWDQAMGVLSNMGGPAGSVANYNLKLNQTRLDELAAQRAADVQAAELTGRLVNGQMAFPAAMKIATMTGRMPNGEGLTLEAQMQAEKIRQGNLPKLDTIGQDPYTGQPIKAWTNPNLAPADTQYHPGAAPQGAGAATPAPQRDSTAPLGSQANPVYAATPDALAQLPPDVWYTTPSAPQTPQRKSAAGAASPPAIQAGAQPRVTTGVPTAAGIHVPETSTPDADLVNLQGPEFMAALEKRYPAQARVVKSWINGEAGPSPASVRTPQGQRLMLWARQADPTFNEMTWPARNKVMKDFSGSGQNAQQVKSAGTLIGHLSTLNDLIDQLHNSDYGFDWGRHYITNPIASGFEKGPGGFADVVNRYNDTRLKVAQELTKLMAGGRGGTVEEVKAAEDAFSPDKSGSVLKGAVKNAIGLMDSRLIEVNSAWNRAFAGSPQEMPSHRGWIDPEHQKILNRMLGNREGVIYSNPLANPRYSSEKAAQRDEQGGGGTLKKPVGELSLPEIYAIPSEVLRQMSPDELAALKQRKDALKQAAPNGATP